MVYNFEVKARAIYMYAGNKSSRKTAKEIGCSKSIVCKWARDADKCILGIQKSKKGYNYKITKHILEFIKKEVSKCSYLRLKDIQQIVYSHFQINLSKTTIFKCLKQSRISRKKSKRFVVKSKAYYNKLEIQRKEFIDKISKIENKFIISIDETAIYKEMKPMHGYSMKGIPVVQTTTSQHHEKYSLVVAITNDKVLHYEIHKGSINKDIFYNFTKALIEKLGNSVNCYFILDNVRFHHNKKIKEYIQQQNNIIYTPPYSPELNPVEMTFSVIKRRLRDMMCKGIVETKKKLTEIISNLEISMFEKFFKFSFNLDNHIHYKIIKDRFIIG